MDIHTLHVASLFLSVAVLVLLALRLSIVSSGDDVAGRFVAVLIGGVFWVGFSALSAVSADDAQAARFLVFHYAAMGFCAPLMMSFCLRFTGQLRSSSRYELTLWVVPAIVFVAVCIDPANFLSDARFVQHGSALLIGSYENQWAYWLHTIHTYAVFSFAYALLVAASFRARAPYIEQNLLVVAAFTLLGLTNIFTRVGIFGFDVAHYDWSGSVMSVLAVLWFIGVTRYRLFELTPVARDTLVETMNDAMLVVDAGDRVVDANPAMGTILGRTAKQVVGASTAEILPAQLYRHLRAGDEPTERSNEVELEVSGEGRKYDVRVIALGTGGPHKAGRLLILQDVTERAAMIRDLDAYAHIVAHDLKSPVGTVTAFTQLLEAEADKLSKNQLEFVETIGTMSRKASKIVDDLLLMASMRGDDVRLENLDTRQIVADALLRLRPTIDEHGAKVRSADVWPASLGKSSWVEEVWVNYLSNAIKHGGRPPRVELGAERIDDRTVRFWVCDNGDGFSDEDAAKLFGELQRFGDRETEGHGLGLSIVRRIVTKLGGEVGANCEPGRGATFWFTLPYGR